MLFIFLFTIILHSHVIPTITASPAMDTKKYSYVCLDAQQDLCLGISPGAGDPYFDPNNIFWLQVKSRTRNEYSLLDCTSKHNTFPTTPQLTPYISPPDKKTRWDLNYDVGSIVLSRFSDLCVARDTGNLVGLFPCNTTGLNNNVYSSTARDGRWNLNQFRLNVNQAGSLELYNSDRSSCLTVMKCLGQQGYCDPNSNDPAIDPVTGKFVGLTAGSYVRMKPCWDSPGSFPAMQSLQIWSQHLDCAVGCPPALEYNNMCDPACNYAVCNDYDSGYCKTQSPTPPTLSPTKKTGPKPTSPPPTNSPTTRSPDSKPTRQPSHSPTQQPTLPPTSLSPTFKPTGSPGVQCPPPGVLDQCAAHAQRPCTKNKAVAAQCTWCFNQCLPLTDPRVCQINGLYDQCPVQCPSDLQRMRCPIATSPHACMKASAWHLANCQWCISTAMCIPGKNPGACTNPNFYSQCGTVAPTQALCPSPRIYMKCVAQLDMVSCQKSWCTWCPTTNDCRPTRDAGVCTPSSLVDLRTGFFGHCPLLQPATPHPGTMQPATAHPFTKHPATAHPGTRQPATAHPVTRHPATAHPVTKHPTGNHTSSTTSPPNGAVTNCPSQYWFNKCTAAHIQVRCDVTHCSWCGGNSFQCRPGKDASVCAAVPQTLRAVFFSNCPGLQVQGNVG